MSEEVNEQEVTQEATQDAGNWYDNLAPDLRNNPTVQKYDSQEAQIQGHLELQKNMGRDKVVWPKDESDSKAWAEVNSRLGVPETADGYDLDAVQMPDGSGVFNRAQFQEFMKNADIPTSNATKLWASYTDTMKGTLTDAQNALTQKTEGMVAELKQKWGEAYETKIGHGQAVIDTFSDSKEHSDYLTSQLSGDPRGQAFLAKLGEQFAEHSIGGFQEKQNFTYSPAEARSELDRIRASADYRSNDDRVRQPLIDRANELMSMTMNSGR